LSLPERRISTSAYAVVAWHVFRWGCEWVLNCGHLLLFLWRRKAIKKRMAELIAAAPPASQPSNVTPPRPF
jgi:hypothetical protein